MRRRVASAFVHDVVILGAGIHGLCSAFELRRRGRDVTVLDRYAVGHDRGGSHGAARIMRSSYHQRRYVELARQAQRTGWPLLSAELGRTLVTDTPGVFFGQPKGLFADFLAATLGAGVPVEQIERPEAQQRFPLLRFEEHDAVMLDHTAGVLAASEAMSGLREWLSDHDVEFRSEVTAQRIEAGRDAVTIETDLEPLRARAVVVATGAWLGELLPEWSQPLTTLRQQVGYVQVEPGEHSTEVGTFPVWCRIGETAEDFVYGLPEFGKPGLKLAHHRTTGAPDDANATPAAIDRDALAELARARLTSPVIDVLSVENCLYAVAPGEELHVVRSELDARIVAVAACSGHGFKFGPVIGVRVADLVEAL